MERPRTKQINCGGGGDDRFSDLPDEVVYDILYLLKMRDHARLMMVSKRCQELCISNPNLNLNNKVKKSSLSRLNNFVDRLIYQRCSSRVKTESLLLCWSFEGSADEYQERRRVNSWLQDLGGVAKVNLQFIHGSHLLDPDQPALALPLCNSTSSVRVDAGDAFLKLPSSPSSYLATKLKILKLNSVRIQKECNLGELLSSFKSLKTLTLNEISGIKRMSLSSSTSNIEILSIVSSDPDHICDVEIQQLHKLHDLDLVLLGNTSTSLQISAPNLRKIRWEGYAVDNYYCITDSPHLLRASLGLRLPRKSRSWGNQAFTNCKYNLDRLLHSVRKCKRLDLRDRFVEVLVKLGCLPFSFDNVTRVNVGRTSITVAQVLPLSSLSSLLTGTTNLKHLKLYNTNCMRDSSMMSSGGELSFKMEYWQSQNLMCIHQLKQAIVELFDRENEIELIKYLLTNAQELEEMTIWYTSPVSSDFITELRKYKKPSTTLFLCSKSYDKRGRSILIKDLYY